AAALRRCPVLGAVLRPRLAVGAGAGNGRRPPAHRARGGLAAGPAAPGQRGVPAQGGLVGGVLRRVAGRPGDGRGWPGGRGGGRAGGGGEEGGGGGGAGGRGERPRGGGAPPLHRGRLLTAARLAGDPEAKRALGRKHDAMAVDMETAALARLCAAAEVPFGC